MEEKISELKRLKHSLSDQHPLRVEEKEKLRLAQERKEKKQKEPERFLIDEELSLHLVQRKIHNILSSAKGQHGEYRLNPEEWIFYEYNNRHRKMIRIFGNEIASIVLSSFSPNNDCNFI